MEQEKMTIGDLAKVVGNLAEEVRSGFARMDAKMATKEEMNAGFAKMATKEEVNEKIDELAVMVVKNMASKEDVQNLTKQVESLALGLDTVKADIKEIKTILNPLPQTVKVHTEELDDLGIRVNKLEDKVFAT